MKFAQKLITNVKEAYYIRKRALLHTPKRPVKYAKEPCLVTYVTAISTNKLRYRLTLATRLDMYDYLRFQCGGNIH